MPRTLRRWWLQEEEQCSFCLGGYSYEIELRCVACDRPSCPHCVLVVRETREVWCPECEEEGGGAAGDSAS